MDAIWIAVGGLLVAIAAAEVFLTVLRGEFAGPAPATRRTTIRRLRF